MVRYRGTNNKGVLDRPWTKRRVSRAISNTLIFQFTVNPESWRFNYSERQTIGDPGPIKLCTIFPYTSVLSKPPQLPYGAICFGGVGWGGVGYITTTESINPQLSDFFLRVISGNINPPGGRTGTNPGLLDPRLDQKVKVWKRFGLFCFLGFFSSRGRYINHRH